MDHYGPNRPLRPPEMGLSDKEKDTTFRAFKSLEVPPGFEPGNNGVAVQAHDLACILESPRMATASDGNWSCQSPELTPPGSLRHDEMDHRAPRGMADLLPKVLPFTGAEVSGTDRDRISCLIAGSCNV